MFILMANQLSNSKVADGLFESIRYLLGPLKGGLGVAVMPRFALEREIAEGRLAELPTAMEHPSMTAVCAWQKGRWKTPAAELFIKLLKEHFALRSQAVLPPGSKRAESREASRPSA